MRLSFVLMLASMLALTSISYAQYGYGTSTITVNQSSITLNSGASAQISYSVVLASGNTWGTNFNINNQAQLSSQRITTSASKTSGNPTYSGVLTISTSSSLKPGTYSIVLSATGDDPSNGNTTVTLNVPAPSTTTIKQSGTNTTTTAASTVTSTAASTSLPSTAASTAYTTVNYYNTGSYSSYSLGKLAPYLAAAIIIILVGAMAEMKKKAPSSRLIVLGVVLILLGIVVWLYGDYSGGNFTYIWSGVALIIIGTLVWLYGDHKGMLI